MGECRYSSTILDSFMLRPLYLLGKSADAHWIGGWVDPKSNLDAVEYKTFFASASNRTPAVQPVAVPMELS
jgi:hypothetical protein